MSSLIRLLRPCAVLGLALLATMSGGRAQDPAPPRLSLNAVLQRVVEQNPSLAAQAYTERAAAASIEQAGYRPNPTLDVSLENVLGTGDWRGGDRLEATVQASQVIERGGKRAKRVALAGRERDLATHAIAVQRTEILAAAAGAYVELLAAQQRLELAAEPLSLARETVAAVEKRVDAAVASPAETARARAALAAAQADHAQAEARLRHARAELAATWGGRAADVTAVDGKLHIPADLPAEDTLSTALAAHPRLGLQQALIEARRAELELERAHAAQDITVGGGVRFFREDGDAAVVAGVSVPLPFSHRNQGNIRAARERLAGAERSVEAVEVELRVAFTAAWQDLVAANAAAQNLRDDALPATEEAYAIVRSAYEQGQLPLIDVLDAQRALIGLRRELLEVEAAYAAALVRVEALTDSSFTVLSALITRS